MTSGLRWLLDAMTISDPQQFVLYDMEHSFFKAWVRSSRQPLAMLQAYADKACRRWRVPLIRVRFDTDRQWYGSYFNDLDLIELYVKPNGMSGRNVPVLLHEVAHHIEIGHPDTRMSQFNDSH